jgi:hypothetical protein
MGWPRVRPIPVGGVTQRPNWRRWNFAKPRCSLACSVPAGRTVPLSLESVLNWQKRARKIGNICPWSTKQALLQLSMQTRQCLNREKIDSFGVGQVGSMFAKSSLGNPTPAADGTYSGGSSMRPAQERRRRGTCRRSHSSRDVLDLERLENRLALSHAPLVEPDVTPGLSPAAIAVGPAPSENRLDSVNAGSVSSAPLRDFLDYRAFSSNAEFDPSPSSNFAPGFHIDVPEVQAIFLTSPAATIGARIAPLVVVIFDRIDVPFESSPTLTILPQSTAHRELDGSVDTSAGETGKLNRPQTSGTPVASLLATTSLNVTPSRAAAEFQGDLGRASLAVAASDAGAVQQKLPAVGAVPAASNVHPSVGILVPPGGLRTIEQVDANQLDKNQRTENDANDAAESARRSGRTAAAADSRPTWAGETANPEASRSDSSHGFAAQRAALLASIGFDSQAVDRALDAAMSEIEQIGGDLMTWFDDYNSPSWATAAGIVTAAVAGSAYVWHGRRRRSVEEEEEAISSTWLFNRFQMPAGQL